MKRILIGLVIAVIAVVVMSRLGEVRDQVMLAEEQLGPGAALSVGSPTPTPASNQTGAVLTPEGAPDYDRWERDAARAKDVIANARASSEAFERLREQLVSWRDAFGDEAARFDGPLKVIEDQIAALGPAPAEGETEPGALAERRRELNGELATERVPQVLALVAASEANGYVREVDMILRDRRADALIARGPGLFSVANWEAAWQTLAEVVTAFESDVESNFENKLNQQERVQKAPAIALLLFGGIWLMVSGGRLIGRVLTRLLPRPGRRDAVELRWTLARIGRLLVRVAGLILIMGAVSAFDLFGPRALNTEALIAATGLFLLVGRWIATTVFSNDPDAPVFVDVSARQKRALRRSVMSLAGILVVAELFDVLGTLPGADDEQLYLFKVPVLIIAGLLLIRHGRLTRQDLYPESAAENAPTNPEDNPETSFRHRTQQLFGSFVSLAGFIAPVLALAGFYAAADRIVGSTIGTLALITALVVLQRVVVGGLSLSFSRAGIESGAAALIPILVGTLMAAASLPFFALIWGVRWAVLVDLWQRVLTGVSIGGITFTLQNIAVFFLVFTIGLVLIGLIKGALRTTILPRTKLDTGAQNAVVTGFGYVGITLATIIAITMAGINLSGLAIVAGALSVGIGFGLRTIVENFVSGIILLIERPVKQGDWIEVGGHMGYVRDISVRSTRIETFDRTDVIVPNADLIAGTVTNYTYQSMVGRLILPVGVAYGSDIELVLKVLREAAEENPMVLLNPPPNVVFQGFGDSALNFEVRAVLRDVNWSLSVKTEINTAIARRLAEAGIEIPFPQRDVWVRNPEALRQPPATRTTAAPDSAPPVMDSGLGEPPDQDTNGDTT